MKHDHNVTLDLWASGMTAQEISTKTGICRGHVCNIIIRARDCGDERAVNRRRGRKMKYDHNIMLDLWVSGMTAQEISAQTGICRGQVCNIIIRARDRGDERAVKRRRGRRK